MTSVPNVGTVKDDKGTTNPRRPKVAFCFMLYKEFEHEWVWNKFFDVEHKRAEANVRKEILMLQQKNGTKADVDEAQAQADKAEAEATKAEAKQALSKYDYCILAHVKDPEKGKTPEWIRNSLVPKVRTGHCERGLVNAQLQLIRGALDDPKCTHCVFLSQACVPLRTLSETLYHIVKSKKTRFGSPDSNTYDDLSGTNMTYRASQWSLMTRHCMKAMTRLQDTPEGIQWEQSVHRKINRKDVECPDEVYPINWLLETLGRNEFKKHVQLANPITFAYFHPRKDSISPSPMTARTAKKVLNTLPKKVAWLFVRKFTPHAAREYAFSLSRNKKSVETRSKRDMWNRVTTKLAYIVPGKASSTRKRVSHKREKK